MNILDIEMQGNDANADTVREYLKKLLFTLFDEGESFSGKRPFGNSDWEYQLYKAFVVAGAVKGTVDEYGDLQEFDQIKAIALVFEAIEQLN